MSLWSLSELEYPEGCSQASSRRLSTEEMGRPTQPIPETMLAWYEVHDATIAVLIFGKVAVLGADANDEEVGSTHAMSASSIAPVLVSGKTF